MKAITPLLVFVILLLQATPSSACSCLYIDSFCETTNEFSNVLEVTILSKYDDGELQSFMDVLVLEKLQGNLQVDTLTVTNYGSSCDVEHQQFKENDNLIITFVEPSPPADGANHLSISFKQCSTHFLRLEGDQVLGLIETDVLTANYEDFKLNLPTCIDGSTTSTELDFLEKNITAAPNPTKDFVTISFENLEVEKIGLEVFGLQGQSISIIEKLSEARFELDLGGLSSGVYFVKIRYGNEIVMKRIAKM